MTEQTGRIKEGLRAWLEQMDGLGEIKHVGGADWELEVGCVSWLAADRPDGPAVLFDNVRGHEPGFRVLGNMLGSKKKLSAAFGIDAECSDIELVQRWREQMHHTPEPIPHVTLETAAFHENVQTGADVNMLQFPTPRWHELDGGRYIGTSDLIITRDPDENWVNVGTYRVMVHDEKTLGFYISPGKHGRIHREKYWRRGEPCPVAMVFGADPDLTYQASGAEVPYGINEYDYLGGWRGEPVQVWRSDLTGLPIPANAEIVVEGFATPDEKRMEGPFGEWTSTYASDAREEPVLKVQRVMYRNNAILVGMPPGGAFTRSYPRSALLWDELEKAGVPDIQGVWQHPAGRSRLLTIVSIKQRYPGHARQAGVLATMCHAGAYIGRYTVVVDEDIDPSNTDEVLWAMCTRSDPQQDIDIIRRCLSGPLDPMLAPNLKSHGLNSRAIIDACKPYEWRDQFPATVGFSRQNRQAMLKRWGETLFGK